MDRRQFLLAASAAAVAGAAPLEDLWGEPVLDIHAHLRRDAHGNAVHCDGAGISHAILLTRTGSIDGMKAAQAAHPGRFYWSASTNPAEDGAADALTQAVEQGAVAFGELKNAIAADSPQYQRLYALAAELDVPIMVHFQEVPHNERQTTFASGFKQFAKMLSRYPRTNFIVHADAVWANLSADYHEEAAYPTGPIKPGGVTDKLLGDYPNIYADLSANSGNNGMSRDPEFTIGFLDRHQDKLLYGSDCFCRDGKGAGLDDARLPNRCLSRETLGILKRSASPEAFTKIVWSNAHGLYKLPA